MLKGLVASGARIGLLIVLAAACAAGSLAAQIPYTVFDERTEVRSIDFRFTAGQSFERSRLREEMVLTERGSLFGIRNALAFLPIISPPPPRPFSPLTLQQDVARIRRFYRESGFPDTRVSYEVEYDEGDNVVDIDLIIEEGRPIEVSSVRIELMDGGDPATVLPESMRDDHQRIVERIADRAGRRYSETERLLFAREYHDWWLNRGWAFAQIRASAEIDTAAATADLRLAIEPGPRARIDPIEVEGAQSVSENVILRTLPFRRGDWFNAEKLAEGQNRLFALDLFRLALIDVPSDQPRDSTVGVLVRLEESPPRRLIGDFGYVSTGGIAATGEFAHHNFVGAARTLRLSGNAETGALAVSDRPDIDYRLSLAFRQPYLGHPRLSLTAAPFGQYRDNLTDRSWQVGMETSLIYQLGPFRFVTLTHRFSSRRILDYRLGSGNANELLELIAVVGEGALDSLSKRIDRSTLALSGVIGRFDPTRPTDALQARPTIEATMPSGWNTIEYVAFDMPVIGYLPIRNRVALAGRVRAGRIVPFGKTIREDGVPSPLRLIRLRDVMLTSGGSGSTRGWGEGLLGPKFVNLRFLEQDDSLILDPEGYAPSGGLARISASAELRLPFPGLGPRWGTHLFLDAGRVWTPDSRFRREDPLDEERWFFGTGAGIDLNTPVGPVRVSLGYKLNPSPLDLRHAEDVFEAIIREQPLSSVPTDWKLRYHLHVSLGQTF